MKMESLEDRFTTRLCGSTGHEIVMDGEVVAWTVDSIWAARIVELLEMAAEGEVERRKPPAKA